MKIGALICLKLDLTQFWPKVVSRRFEITTDETLETETRLLFLNYTLRAQTTFYSFTVLRTASTADCFA